MYALYLRMIFFHIICLPLVKNDRMKVFCPRHQTIIMKQRMIHDIIIKRPVDQVDHRCSVIHRKPWQQGIKIKYCTIFFPKKRRKHGIKIILGCKFTNSSLISQIIKCCRKLMCKKISGQIANLSGTEY